MNNSMRRAVIITALPEERQAVVEHLRQVKEEPPLRGSVYRRGVFDERSEPWEIILAEVGAGNPGAAAEAERVIAHYSPSVALFVGIAGAIKDMKKGDVIASSKIYLYESGKDQDDGFKPRPSVELSAYGLEQRARYEAGENSWKERIKNRIVCGQVVEPNAKVGPIAAGEKVLASNRSQIFNFIRGNYSDALAVEMEGHGFLLGVRMNHPTLGLVIRSISDTLSDKDEGNDNYWQPVAASHAAAFAFQILSKLPPMEGGPSRETTSIDKSLPQQFNISDISGGNNNINIESKFVYIKNMSVNPSILLPSDADSEINNAASNISTGNWVIGIHMLSEIRKRRWHELSSRSKFRVAATEAQAYEAKGELKQAAKFYLEANHYQPNDEQGRAFEAISWYYLGDNEKAYGLASEILRDHPTFSLAVALRIRCAPMEVSLEKLETMVPNVLRDSLDIMHALGWRALTTEEYAAADRIASAAKKIYPESGEIKELLATIIVCVETRPKRVGQKLNKERLTQAISVLSEGITRPQGSRNLAFLRYYRGHAYDLLGRTEDAETDFRAAIDTCKEEPGIVRSFAFFLERNDRLDAAIETLRQSDKVMQNIANRLLFSGLLRRRNGNGDNEEAIKLLKESLTLNIDFENRAEILGDLTHLLGLLGRHKEAFDYINDQGDEFLRPPILAAIRCKASFLAGNKQEAVSYARNGLDSLGPESPQSDRMRVAEALGFIGDKIQALDLWKGVLRPDRIGFFELTALDQAKECEDDDFIMNFCEGLRSAGLFHPFALELEVLTLEKYGIFEKAISIIQAYLVEPLNENLAKVLRVRLSLLGDRLSKPDLIETDVEKLPLVKNVPTSLGVATANILRLGQNPLEGVKYAYELVRNNYDDPIARQGYIEVLGIGEEMAGFFPEPYSVAPGCAVLYKCNTTSEEKWIILEDGEKPCFNREEIGVDHELSKDLIGKHLGDLFHLRRDPIQSKFGTILKIISKYLYRKYEILNSWEMRFPERFFITQYTTSTKEDGSPDVSPILKALDIKEKHVQELNEIYLNKPFSVSSFSVLSDLTILDSLSHLASEEALFVRCCLGTDEELSQAILAIEDPKVVVIDPAALATLFFSGKIEIIKTFAGKCVICNSALEEYIQKQSELAKTTHGFAVKVQGKYLFRDNDKDEISRHIDRLKKFVTNISELVTIKNGANLARIKAQERRKLIKIFGQPTAEALAEAAATGGVLWTDDLSVAEVAKHNLKLESRVWTQAVFISKASVHDRTAITIFLLQWRYFFTRLDHEIVIEVCRLALFDTNDLGLVRISQWFSKPELNQNGAVKVCVLSLRMIWREDVSIEQKKDVTKLIFDSIKNRQNGFSLLRQIKSILSKLNSDEKIFNQCNDIIDEVLRLKVGPATDASKAAWAKAIRQMQINQALSDKKKFKYFDDLTPRQRAERWKKDRKKKEKNK